MKVLIADKISNDSVVLLKNHFEVRMEEVSATQLLEIIPEYDALIVRSRTKVTEEIINAGTKLKVIGRAGIGVDNIHLETANKNNLPVVYAPRGSTVSVAEITVAQILNLARDLIHASNSTKEGKWIKKSLKGMEISGKTLGLIGLGRIGIEVAKRCNAFDMKTIAYDPYISQDIAEKYNIQLYEDVNKIFEQSDFISIHSVLTDETRGMVNKSAFKKMKNSAFIINHSRGGIIEEKALVEALKTKEISGAALDVFETEPLQQDSVLLEKDLNLLLTPHIGASTVEAPM